MHWQPIPVVLAGKSHGRRSLVGCRLWGCTESDMTEATQQQHVINTREQFGVHSKIKRKIKKFLTHSLPLHCITSPIINTAHINRPHLRGTFVTLTHHQQPKSIVYIMYTLGGLHSELRQIYNGMYPQLQYDTEHSQCHKTPLCSACSSLSPNSWQPAIFLLSLQLSLFQNVIQMESFSMQPFQIGYFVLVIYIYTYVNPSIFFL